MHLTVTYSNGTTTEHEGTVAQLLDIVREDLLDQPGITPQELNGQLRRLKKPVDGVRSTTLVDGEFKPVVTYRMVKAQQSAEDAPGLPNDAENDVARELADESAAEPEGDALTVAYEGGTKDFWPALASRGGGHIASAHGVQAVADKKSQEVTLYGAPAAQLQDVAQVLRTAWPLASAAAKAWFRTPGAWGELGRATHQERKARFAVKEGYLEDFCKGYAAASTGAATAPPAGASQGYSDGWAAAYGA